MAAVQPAGAAPRPTSSVDIVDWRPEDNAFWESTGKKIANRNLWISVPSLLCGFAVWLMWGIITVQMANLGFPFTQQQLFTLAAISGLSGATLRIPASFFIRISGGRNTIFLTTALLMIPALGTGIALSDKSTPLWVFQFMALLSGIGGGNFACSMSNINTFFPKRLQGTALGINAGLGNFGVTTMQILIPLVMTTAVFMTLGGDPMTLVKPSGTLIGKIPAGTPTYIQNAGYIWLVLLVPLAFAGWFGMNNLLTVSPNIGSTVAALGKILLLYGVALITAAIGLYLYLPATGLGLLNMWVAMPLIIVATLLAMKLVAFGEMKPNLKKQFEIFKDKHTWSMTLLYIVTFGSFIGFSNALPLSINVIFGQSHVLGPRRRAQAPAESECAVGADLRVDRPLRRRADPAGRWLDLRQGRRFDRHADHLRRHGDRVGGRGLRDDARLRLGHARAVLPAVHRALHRAVRRQRHRQRLDLPHRRRDLRSRSGRTGAGLDLGDRRLWRRSSRRSSSASRSGPARRSTRCTASRSSMRCA